jgi:nucleotide-binding universal stress UspA family protein
MTSDIAGRRIVAAVDGSPSSVQAALWAATEAAQRHEPLLLLHAVDQRGLAFGSLLAPDYFDVLEADGRQILAEAESQIRQLHPGLDVKTSLHRAGAVPSLIEVSRSALLVVVGSRGMGGFGSILLGSTAVGVVAYGHCPVAVIRGQSPSEVPPTRGPVVVGVDGSTTSDAAVATAFDEASWRDTDLVAVHAQPWLRGFAHPPQHEWKLNDPESEVLAERLAGWQEKYPDVKVRRIVGSHSPVASLLESAVEAQLLVVGSRGRGGFTGMLLGSTSQALIYHATCPVLVVRPDQTV